MHIVLGFIFLLAKMVKGFPVEDRFDGVSNYGSWKPRVLMILEENDVKDFALKEVPFPDDVTQQTTWRKSDVKARKILMDSVRNHLISVIAKETIDNAAALSPPSSLT